MTWPDDNQPRYIAQETPPLRKAKRGTMLVLDRAYNHQLICECAATASEHRKATEKAAALNAADTDREQSPQSPPEKSGMTGLSRASSAEEVDSPVAGLDA